MPQVISPAVMQMLTLLIALSAVIGCVFAVTTFFRQGGWRTQEASAKKDTRIENLIVMVDQEARAGVEAIKLDVARVEGKVDAEVRALLQEMKAGDSELRNSLQAIASRVQELRRSSDTRLAGIEEHLKHLPTHTDMAKVIDTQAANRAGIESGAAKIEGLTEMVRTLRDYLMAKV